MMAKRVLTIRGGNWLTGTLPCRSLVFAGAGMAGLLALAAFLQHFPAFFYQRPVSEPFWWLFASGMLACYWYGYRAIRDASAEESQCLVIVIFAIVFCLLSFLIIPFHSIDLSGYINIGWQQAGYGASPYVTTLADIPNRDQDPMFRPSPWECTPCAYGFLFCRLAKLFCEPGQWQLALFLFRALGVLVFLGAGWVVWRGSRLMGIAKPERSLFLFLWNPLVLMMFPVEGHNDLWMGLCTALSIFFAVAGVWLPVLPLLAMATLLKHYSAILFPFLMLYLVRRIGWKKTAVSMVLGLLLGIGIGWPYLVDFRDFQFAQQLQNAGEMHNSLMTMLYFPFEIGQKHFPWLEPVGRWFVALLRPASSAGFVVFLLAMMWRRFRAPSYEGRTLLRDAVLLHFVLICLATPKFYCWYLGMFFPLALWLPEDDWLRRAVLAISAAQLLSLTFIGQAHFLNVLIMLVLPLAWALARPPSWQPRLFAPGQR